MKDFSPRQIVPGITIDSKANVTTDADTSRILFDLAIILEEKTPYPVDVEHVLAAIVLASQAGELSAESEIRVEDERLIQILKKYVTFVFSQYGGVVGEEP